MPDISSESDPQTTQSTEIISSSQVNSIQKPWKSKSAIGGLYRRVFEDGLPKAVCTQENCKSAFSIKGGATTYLSAHYKENHPEAYVDFAQEHDDAWLKEYQESRKRSRQPSVTDCTGFEHFKKNLNC